MDAPQLDASDPIPFLFDGENMDGKPETKLAAFPASELFDGTTIAVETNISTYSIPARGNSQGRTGYTMSGTFLSSPEQFWVPLRLSSLRLRVSNDSPVSPRANKKAGQPAVFSDED